MSAKNLQIKGRYRGKRVGVLLGGPSGEREVSLRSGKAVGEALKSRGYDVIPLDPKPTLIEDLKRERIEVVYNVLHGTWGEDGLVQALLETAAIPYTGSGVLASAVTMHKVFTKRVLLEAGFKTPAYRALRRGESISVKDLPATLPVVVKPASEGSSLGVTICKKESDLPAALQAAFALDPMILVEAFVPGRELTVSVVSGHALPVVEIVPSREFYDYQAKYTPGGSKYFCPADIDKNLAAEMQRVSERVCALFECQGGVRVDYRVNPEGEAFIIELNTSPGMTELSLLPMAAKAAGYSYADLTELVLDTAEVKERVQWR